MPKWTTYANKQAKMVNLKFQQDGKSLFEKIENEMAPNGGEWNDVNKIAGFYMFIAAVTWYNRPSIHIFIKPEMEEFLISSVKQILPCYFIADPLYKALANTDLTKYAVKMAFIHTQSRDEKGRSTCVFLSEATPAGSFNLNITLPGPNFLPSFMGWNPTLQPHGLTIDDLKHSCNSNLLYDAIRLTLGLSLYLEAFPDALQEFQAPEKAFKGKRNLTLRVPKEVQEDIDHSVSPHYRRGHMRLLTSERYTEEKRGKAVFVKGCFVKGKAYELVG